MNQNSEMEQKTPICRRCGVLPRDLQSWRPYLCKPCRLDFSRALYAKRRGLTEEHAEQLSQRRAETRSTSELACRRCAQLLPRGSFNKSRFRKSGADAYCRSCRKEHYYRYPRRKTKQDQECGS